jgi:hypothetical protein
MFRKKLLPEWTAVKLQMPHGPVTEPTEEEIQEFIRTIESAGGRVGFNRDAPTWVQRAFMEEIMNCPDCREEFEKARRKTH